MIQRLIAAICIAGALAFAGLVWADVDFDSLGRPMPVPVSAMSKAFTYSNGNMTAITLTAPDGSHYVNTLSYATAAGITTSVVSTTTGWVKQ